MDRHQKSTRLGTCSVLGSGIARADESAYIQMLDVGGVPYDTRAGAVLMGDGVCTSLQNGNDPGRIEHGLMVGGRSAGEADWTQAQAVWLISAAVIGLCPQEEGVLKAYGPPFFISPHNADVLLGQAPRASTTAVQFSRIMLARSLFAVYGYR